jgi:hypothetical protein
MGFPCKIVKKTMPDLAKGVSRTTTTYALGTTNIRTIAKKYLASLPSGIPEAI